MAGTVGDTHIAAGAVDGGNLGEIADGSVTADDLGTDSVNADELNATGVEAELEAVLDLDQLQGSVTDSQVPNTITIDLATTATTANAGDSATSFFASGTIEAARLPSNGKIGSFGATFDGGGSALVAGTAYVTVPFACTISAINILVDTGTATFSVWRLATGTAIPTVANTISTAGIAISSGTALL